MFSMTGIGRASIRGITCEVRSTNHRYLEVNLRLPAELEEMSEEIRAIVRKHCQRGSVSVTIHLDDRYLPLSLNKPRLKKYISLFTEIKRDFPISGDLTLSDLLALPGLFTIEPEAKKGLFQKAKEATILACQRLRAMRKEEGENLLKDFLKRLKRINLLIREIKNRIPRRLKEKKEAMIKRFRELNTSWPENRIQEEVTILADRTDVSEELTRLASHSRLFSRALHKKETSGRKLEFILQEMLRESETLSAKARDFLIAKEVIEIKEEIEKMREQVRNVE
jgi:uncharacterized protein (TIGR00255 family)